MSKITFTKDEQGVIRIEAHMEGEPDGAFLMMLGIHSLALDIDTKMLKNLMPDDAEQAAKIYSTVRTLTPST